MAFRALSSKPQAVLARVEQLLADDARARSVTAMQIAARQWPLAEFFRRSWAVLEPGTSLVMNWHISTMCSHVAALLQGKLAQRNLMLNVPPGMGKSRIVNVCAIAWWWLRRPDWKFICASGNPRVAVRDSLLCRTLIESSWYRSTFAPNWHLQDDENTKTLFSTSAGGTRTAVTAGSKIIGSRGDTLIVDDAMDPAEVYSEAVRTGINVDWYDMSFANRLNSMVSGTRIIAGTRLHTDDLPGHVLAREAKDWEVLSLPMEFVEATRMHTSLGSVDPRTHEGELLFEARFPEAVLAQERLRLGSAYAGQYQQQPRDLAGEVFKADCLQLLAAEEIPQEYEQIIISLDCAYKLRESADFSVATVLGKCDIGIVILDVIRGRYAYPQLQSLTEQLALKWKPSVTLIEDAASGQSLVQSLEQQTALAIKKVKPDGAKEVRAHTVTPLWEAGRVFAPRDAPWLPVFLDEMCSFPKGAHDDIVDSFCQGARYLTQAQPSRAYMALLNIYHAGASPPSAQRPLSSMADVVRRTGAITVDIS